MNEVVSAPAGADKSSNAAPLSCRLLPKVVLGRQGPIPNMAELELENCSAAPLEIAYTMTPLQFLELEVIGPGGECISEDHFSDRFSPMREAAILRLLPGEKFTANVALFATVPHEKRCPGTYTIKASYCFQNRRIMAEPLCVTRS